MCGIAGGFAFTEKGKSIINRIEQANDCLKLRGPDGGAVFRNSNVALGHRRLSIIDTSAIANQPMISTDKRYCIIFNGEIFNYRELKEKYFAFDRFDSSSDTEVFLKLFILKGSECFKELRGFFAAAVYDRDEDTLVLVRDRYGKKPLLYFQDEDKLCFASELKSLFHLEVPKVIDWSILPIYLQLSYVPQPYSFIKGVQKLLPGHYMVINKEGITIQSYYQLQLVHNNYGMYGYEEAQKQLVSLMDEAVRLRLISDVPLGAFLSGGIDSSVIVALAARHTPALKTFSIGYKDNPFFDETAYAELVAKKYKTDHTVFRLSNNDFLEHVYSVLDYIDEPFADSSAIPEFILSYYTRKHVTVALSGDGGDEVFAGYNKHAAEWRMRQGGLLKKAVKMGAPVWKMLPKSRNHRITNVFRQLDRFASGATLSQSARYWQWASFTPQQKVQQLLYPAIKERINNDVIRTMEHRFTNGIHTDDFNEVLLADMNMVLLSDMLVKVDLMSMANSLEIRSPFLDQEVVDFAFSLPSEYKIDGQMKKRIVQDAFRSYLPAELYNRPKHGFEIPLLDWFRKELWGLINDDLLEDQFIQEQKIFNGEAIRQLKKQLHSSNPGDSPATVWALIVFQHWWKNYITAG